WGSGNATRDFLYVEDAAEALIAALEKYDKSEPVNIGSGREISIRELVETVARLMQFTGEIRFDTSKPEGQARFAVSTERAQKEFGFNAKTSLEEGLRKTIAWYQGANK